DKFRRSRPESLRAPAVGLDCATLDLGGDLAVLSCDPITSSGIEHLGRLTVHVCCNDAAAAGAEPVGLLVTLLAPPDGTEADIGRIADDIAEAAGHAGVDILGGHTEVTDAVTRYVTSSAVLARLPRQAALRGLRRGDDIVMTKYAGLEGSAILLADHAGRLPAPPAPPDNLLEMISVVPESRVAMRHGASAMHDVTEGGVLGALWEMCELGGCGIRVDTARIPLLPVTRALCAGLRLDPLRLIGSGSLLIACPDGEAMRRALEREGVPAALIGRAEGEALTDERGARIPPPAADEIYRLS
ncbi:MAG: AIR synthase-related protein, partial [Clostridia bacterium]|nr:AIR synthase-related protein [Clostridia bacterium]